MSDRSLLLVALTVVGMLAGDAVSAHAQSVGDELTIDQAVTRALQQNRSIRNNQLEVQKVDDALAGLRTRRRPEIQVNFFEMRLLGPIDLRFAPGSFGVFPATGPIPTAPTTVSSPASWSSIMVVRATQPLSQLYKIGLGERQLELGRDLASERVRGQQQAVANNVRRLYYGILQTQNGIQSLEQSLALHEEIDRLVGQYVREGMALQSDGLEVQALIAKEQTERLVWRNTAATLHEQLNALLGRDIATPFTVTPAPDFPADAEELAALEARAVEARPEVKQAALAVRQAELDVRVKRSALFPDVSAMFNYIGLYHVDVLPPSIAAGGVLATWEPWDWGRKRREIAQSEKSVEQARAAPRDAEALVRIEVRSGFRKLAEARAAVRVTELVVQAAREKLRVATDLNREQKNLLRDVLQAQAALATADQQHNDALMQLATARADLEKAVGDR